MTTTDTIRLCIERCAKAKDGRGAWRAERDCHQQLFKDSGNDAISAHAAAAARRIGEWLRSRA